MKKSVCLIQFPQNSNISKDLILNTAEVLIKLEDDKEVEKQKLIPIPWISECVTEMTEFWNWEKADGGNFGFLSSSLNKVKCYFVAKPLLQSSHFWWLKK